jgi:transposase-like protein
MCTGCGRKTSVTAGTIFHRSHTPLSTWFAAAWFVTSQKNGVSALGLQQALGFGSYETAWAWLHKLRRAMVRPDREMLHGVVELDEAFIGGQTPRQPGRATDKIPVIIAVERVGAHRLGRVRFGLPQRYSSSEQIGFAQAVIQPGSIVRTDGLSALRKLSQVGFIHEYTNGYQAEDITDVLPGVHRVASLLKRWIAGTLHHNISAENMPYYLDEYAFRFNRRNSRARGLLFYRLLQQAVAADPHPLSELTRK